HERVGNRPHPLDRPLLVMIDPPARDLLTRGDPDVTRLLAVLDHLAQPGDAPGLPHEARMRSEREHLRIARTCLAAELVEPAPHHLDVLGRRSEALCEDEA